MRNDLRCLGLRRHGHDRKRNRRARRSDQQVHLLLIDQPVGVCDALVGFALVVEQRQFDRVTIDAAGGVDRREFVLDHLALFFAIVRDHA